MSSEKPQIPSTHRVPPTEAKSEADPIDPLVAEILDEYFELLQGGNPPSVESLVAAHPEVADELRSCLEGIQLVHASTHESPQITSDMLQQLGDFRIIREVGRGGMGVVYEAEQISLKRRVALKVLRYAVADPEAMTRFRREAETVAKLHHSNIVPIFAVGEENGVNYFAMQFIDGQSLAEVQRDADEPLDALDVADWGLQAAEALAYAHEHDIIHRDVKPSNLIRDPEGRVWLTDFGLAKRLDDVKLSMTGAILGTPRYMSPEQASSVRRPVDHRTDVYSLGATLYELATNQPLFDATSPHIALGQIISEEPVAPRTIRPKLARDLETIIMRCLSKDAEHRYDSATELVEDLRAFTDGRAINARRPSWAEQLGRWLQKNQRIVTTAATAASIAAMLIVGSWLAIQGYYQSKLGHIQFESIRDLNAPLVAEVLRDDGTSVVPSFTLPTQHPVEIPAGDYELKLHSSGTMSDSYRFSVEASKERHELRLNLENRNAWPPTKVAGDWAAWPRPDGTDFVVFDEMGITLLDGETSAQIWQADLRSQREKWRENGLQNTTWNWWSSSDSPATLSAISAFGGYAHITTQPMDCDNDGTEDLILACKYRPAVIALSGADGSLLWCHVASRTKRTSFDAGGVLAAGLVANVDSDQIPDLIACYAVEEPMRNTTRCSVRALSGTDGELLWEYEVDPALHNTNRMPYAPYAAKWHHEPGTGIRASASEQRGDVWGYRQHGVAESRNNNSGEWVPYAPVFDPNTDGELVLFAGSKCLKLNVKSGDLVSSCELPDTPVRPPQWVDSDGDGTQELLICTRVHPKNKRHSGLAVKDHPALHIALWDSELTAPKWEKDIKADWEWLLEPTDTVRNARQWPLLSDLDADGTTEIVMPAVSTADDDVWRVVQKGKLQTLELASGKTKWTSDSILNMESQLDHFTVVDDVDGDGTRDVATVTQFCGPEPGRSKREKARLFVFVDVLSGSSGKKIRRIRSRPALIEHSHRTTIYNVELFRSSLLLVELARPARQNGVGAQALLFDLALGRLVSSTDRAQRPQGLDIDGDHTKELICWTPTDRHKPSKGGLLYAWKRSDKPAGATWKYIDQHLQAVSDVDGDGIDDAVQMSDKTQQNFIHMVSGATGRYLWKRNHGSSGTIHVDTTQSDFDADGVADVLVSEYSPLLKRQSPLTALSSRTGNVIWQYRMQQPGTWSSAKFLGSTDLDGDGNDEVLFLIQGIYDNSTSARVSPFQQPLRLFCFDHRGRIRWTSVLLKGGSGAHTLLSHYVAKILDVNDDGVRDLVGYSQNQFGLCSQAWSGRNGDPLWDEQGGQLQGPRASTIHVNSFSRYPHFCGLEGNEAKAVFIDNREGIYIRALHGRSGEPAWSWSSDQRMSISMKSGFGEQRLYGNPVPIPFRTKTGTHLGFWFQSINRTGNSCEFVLLDRNDGHERKRLTTMKLTGDLNAALRIWAADMDGDGLDEVVYSTATHVVAYSLTDSKPLWEFEIPSKQYRIKSVQKTPTGQVETRLLILDGNHTKEIVAIDQQGQLAWSHVPPISIEFTRNNHDWLDVLESHSGQQSPKLLYRTEDDVTTTCRAPSLHRKTSKKVSDPETTTTPAVTLEKSAAVTNKVMQQADPRYVRRLPVGVPNDAYSFLIRPALLACFIVVLPVAYLRRLARGRWTLRTFMLLPLVVATAILAIQWPAHDNPTTYSNAFWNVIQALTTLVAWVPFVVLLRLVFTTIARRNWTTAAMLGLGWVGCTILTFLAILNSAGYFQETVPVRYTSDGWWMCLFGGLQMFGVIVTLILISVVARRRFMSLITRKPSVA